MSDPPKGAAAWFARAEGDLLNVENNLHSPVVPWETIVFHARQTIEKYLKGLLVQNGAAVPKTHDLAALIRACEQFVPGLKVFEVDCAAVSTLYLSSRYPETSDPSEADAHKAIGLAQGIKSAILPHLQP